MPKEIRVAPDGKLWRVLREIEYPHFVTVATYATEREAGACAEGVRIGQGDDLAAATYEFATSGRR